MTEATSVNGLYIHACKDLLAVTNSTASLFKGAVKRGAQNVSIGVGRTQYPLYRLIANDAGALIEAARQIDYFQLDEYLGVADPDHPELLLNVITKRLLKPIGHPERLRHVFNMGVDPEIAAALMEQEIEGNGGLDLIITGIGDDGHIAWNTDGTEHNSLTHVTTLSDGGIIQNAELWGSSENVPRCGITMGLGTTMKTDNFILMASGENKAQPLFDAIHGDMTEKHPSAILRRMAAAGKQVTVVADYAALSKCDLSAP